MTEHLGLIEMLTIFGIGIFLVTVELIKINAQIRRDRRAPPADKTRPNDDSSSG